MKWQIALGVAASIVLTGCGSTKLVTTTETQTQTTSTTVTTTETHVHVKIKRGPPITTTQTTTHTLTASSPAYEPSSSGQSFSGNGEENIGTVHVRQDSELYWSCPSCGGDNFTIENSDGDSDIAVNALGPTSGKTFIDAGTYHDVTVNTEGGDWTLSIHPG